MKKRIQKNISRKIKSLHFIIFSICILFCSIPFHVQAAKNEKITILYENDVHCAVDGYAKLAAMKEELADEEGYVGVVSIGDYIQGGSMGAVSQGEYIVNIMNLVGYDAVTLGNHEFDYRLPRLMELVELMNTKPVCSNFREVGKNETVFEPYTIVTYGDVDIAYVGITTPSTRNSSAPAQFMNEQGDSIYSFDGEILYDTVQNAINAAKQEGADYIIALSHLGTEFVEEEWSAQAVVRNTEGLDVVLDGHSHSVIEGMSVKDKNGEDVLITSTGTKFANIGKLVIDEGLITTELIPTEMYEQTDADVTEYLEQITAEYEKLGNRLIGESKVTLTTVDGEGRRLIRNEETNMGDFCADAFRIVTGADIGFMNGGGIRADIPAGDITFNDILNVFPWNNTVCVAEVTGQQIIDMLELGCMNYPEEDGTFQHVSGITFTLNTSISSSVRLDKDGMFVSVDGPYRVEDVKVFDSVRGEYVPIDPEKEYKLASHNYLLLEQGGGATMFKDAVILNNDGKLDVELLEIYITEHLAGIVGEEYESSQNRIAILNLPQTETSLRYRVCYGDTLWALSRKYHCTVDDIVKNNQPLIKNPDLIYAGWEIMIP